jgi:transposase
VLSCGMQAAKSDIRFADTTVINYINEIKSDYEYQIKELQLKYERQNTELKNNVIEYHNKYLEIKERYDILVYRKFVRSAEKFIDETQKLLFTENAEKTETIEEEDIEETTEVKSYKRKKPGRKAIDPSIPRVEKIIDIPEEDKICS